MALDRQQYQQNDLGRQQYQRNDQLIGGYKPPKTYTVNDFQQYAQNRYGRQATQEDLAKIGAHVGYQGGDIGEDQWGKATAYADTLAEQMGWKRPAQSTQPTTPTTAYTPGPGVAPPVLQPKPAPSQMDLEAQRRIQQLLGTKTGEVDTGSLEYQGQLGSFKRSQQGAMERAKRAAAERAAGSGTLSSGGFDAGMSAMDTAGAEQVGNFEAQLAGQQLGRQREDLQQGLQLAQQRGLTDQANSLQERLAQLNATMQQQGLNLQGELGRGDLDLRKYLGKGNLGLGLLGTLLQDKQAGNRLGFDYSKLGLDNDSNMLRMILGGL